MKNKDLLEYLRVCDGTTLINDIDLERCTSILDSEVSIKKYFETLDIFRLSYIQKLDWTIKLFDVFESEIDRKEILNLIKHTIVTYRKHNLSLKDLSEKCRMIIRTLSKNNSNEENKKLISKLKVEKFRDRGSFTINDDKYMILGLKDGKVEKVDLLGVTDTIEDIGAITYKDDKISIHKVNSKREQAILVKQVINKFDYDLAYVAKGMMKNAAYRM